MTLTQEYFDQLYDTDEDPWLFRSRPYELRKRALTIAALPEERYAAVFEPGCSIGLLTAELSARSEHILAMDISPFALARAASEVPGNVELRQGAIPDEWPSGRFDLIVLSEIGYYLCETDCRRLVELATQSAQDIIAVHWRHPVDDYPLSGDQVHAIFAEVAEGVGMAHLVGHFEQDLNLDVWSWDERSVAQRTGLVSG